MLYLAHAGENHETLTQAAAHNVFDRWYIALPLFIVGVCGIATIAYFASHKSKATTYIVILATLFITGVATYTLSAPVSIFAISVGFVMALLQVLIGLGKPHNEVEK